MRIKIVYIGRDISIKNKALHVYHKLGEDDEVSTIRLVFQKKITPGAIGAIYEVEEIEDGVRSPYNFKGFLKDIEQLGVWRAEDAAKGLKLQSYRDRKKVPKNTYDDAVSQLGYIYQTLGYAQREAFLFRLMSDIRKAK